MPNSYNNKLLEDCRVEQVQMQSTHHNKATSSIEDKLQTDYVTDSWGQAFQNGGHM